MLTRLYIDNFRCFEKFEWKPGRKELILGRNGTGKTSVMDALRYLRRIVARGDRLETWFKLNQRTLWLHQSEQFFEIDAELEGARYSYQLVLAPKGKPARPAVKAEQLKANGKRILASEEGKLIGHEPDSSFTLDQSRTALSTVAEDSSRREVRRFRNWLSAITCAHINPFFIEARAEKEAMSPRVDLANFAGWYRHLLQARRKEDSEFLTALRKSLDGFDQLSLQDAGESVRVLYAEFAGVNGNIKIPFGELS